MNAYEGKEVIREGARLLAEKLSPAKQRGLLQFFNTSFGLWLLSSVFIGGITFAYATLTAKWAADRAHSERFARLDAELELRFQPIVKRIQELQMLRSSGDEPQKGAQNDDDSDDTDIEEPVSKTIGDNLTPEETRLLFHKPIEDEQYQREFSEYTVKALFAEGYFLSRNANEKAAIHAALAALEWARGYEHKGALLDSGNLAGAQMTVTVDQKNDGSEFQKKLIERFTKFYLEAQRSDHANARDRYEHEILTAWDLWQHRASYDPKASASASPSVFPTATSTPKPRKIGFNRLLSASLETVRGGPAVSPDPLHLPLNTLLPEAEVLSAIDTFKKDPFGALKSGAATKIVDFAEASPTVNINIGRKVMPWVKGGVDERRTILLVAYYAGSTESQLRRMGVQEPISAGTWQVIDTYRQLQQRDGTFRLLEVDALIQIDNAGRLQEHVYNEWMRP